MYLTLVSIVIFLFVCMLFLNIYFRINVFKSYKVLVENKVEFGAKHIFSDEKLEKEIYPKYPDSINDIKIFVKNIRKSIKMATVLSALITLFGAILMYYRYE